MTKKGLFYENKSARITGASLMITDCVWFKRFSEGSSSYIITQQQQHQQLIKVFPQQYMALSEI